MMKERMSTCNKRSKNRSGLYIKIFFAQWSFFFIVSILSFFYVGDLIQVLINNQLVVSPDSDIYPLWERPPVTPEMKIYLFNLTNVDSWLNGSDQKLKLDQVGPFVYRETWKKENITFHNDRGTVSFYLRKVYEFLPERSSRDDVTIVLPNIPLFSAAASMKDADSWSLMGFNAALNLMDADSRSLFIHRTAKEIIWGYDDTLSSMASLVLPEEEVGLPGKFGLFAGKNDSLGGLYTVETGAKNLTRLSQTVAFRGRDSFKAWTTDRCNKVRGADGSFFPPWIKTTDTLEIFVPDMCSTIPLVTDGEEVILQPGHVKGFRFRPDPRMFNYDWQENECLCSSVGPKVNLEKIKTNNSEPLPEEDDEWFTWPENRKKRSAGNNCPKNGVFNLAPCKFGAPLYVSWPHFFNADPVFRNAVEGLAEPTEEDHGFRMDIQPMMGIGLAANVRLQMNLKMEQTSVTSRLANLPIASDDSLLLPIMWFDNVIERPPENLLIMLGEALSTGDRLARGVLIFSSSWLTIQLIIFAMYTLWKRSNESEGTSTDDLVLESQKS